MEKIKITSNTNNSFISGWKTDNYKLMDQIIEFYENNPDLQNEGVQGFDKVNKEYKDTSDIAILPKNLLEKDYSIFNKYISHIHDCYQDYRKQWEFFGSRSKKINVGTFNVQKI
ncbi:MAG: hypothetical protein ACJZ9D_01915 [Alphaproteobacteria bacterium]